MNQFLVFITLLGVTSAVFHARSPILFRGGRSASTPMYENNGGTVIAIAGDSFAILAADTRLSKDYSILTRNSSRIWELTPRAWIGVGGCMADVLALIKILQTEIKQYEWEQGRTPSISVISQLLSTVLYQRRSQPFYSFCILAGVDESAHGAVFTYDAVGSFEKVRVACVGGAQAIVLPILDQMMQSPEESGEFFFQKWPSATGRHRWIDAPLSHAIDSVKIAAAAADGRDIRVGDSMEIVIIQNLEEANRRESFALHEH